MFLGVPGLSDPDSMRDFVNEQGVGAFQHVDDPTAELWTRFGVTQQRTYVFIDDDGSFRLSDYGNLPGDVEALLAG